MVLIFSEAFDISTDEICDWLVHYGVPFLRINGKDFSGGDKPFRYSFRYRDGKPELHFSINGREADATVITAVWFRRDEPVVPPSEIAAIPDGQLRRRLTDHAFRELTRCKEYFYHALLTLPHLGNHLKKEVNKFVSLSAAARNGLAIPETLLSNDPDRQRAFLGEQDGIVKAIRDTDFFPSDAGPVMISYTTTATPAEVGQSRFPALLQYKIDKEIEIRVFYIQGKCYPMAIFSQLDAKTEVDFRRYNYQKPNRNVPYKLPLKIETALIKTMQDIDLDTGSIDLIKATDGTFYFLEVNPVGQFGMTSKPCNYHIERDIARLLSYGSK